MSEAIEYEQFEQSEQPDAERSSEVDLSRLSDVPMELSVEIGRAHMTVGETLDLSVGSVVTLERLAGEAADLLVNGSAIARGEVVVMDEQYGLRITEILDVPPDSEPAQPAAQPATPAADGAVAAAAEEQADPEQTPSTDETGDGEGEPSMSASEGEGRSETAAVQEPERRAEAEDAATPGESARVLDFSQPTKFTTELRRRIGRSLDLFCDALAGWMAGELKAEVEVSLGDVSQHTWAAAKAQLPAASIAAAIEAESIERQMLLSAELPLILQALECLLGGKAAQAPAERHLTEIDWMLTRGVLDAIVHQLSVAWEELGGTGLVRGEVDIEGDAGVLTPIGEPTLSVTLDAKIDGLSSTMALLIPWSAIEPVAASIRGSGSEPISSDPHNAEALRRGVAGAQVLVRAEVGSVQMPIERMLELAPGALLELEDGAEDGVLLFAEGVSLGRGRPGRSGPRRAVKLTSTGEPPVRADTYAKLGRSELERARAHLDEARESPEGREILRSIFVRVWAELGRTHLPLGAALELTQGALVELDQVADAPVELFANGLCFANGSLVVTGDGAWGVQLLELIQ